MVVWVHPQLTLSLPAELLATSCYLHKAMDPTENQDIVFFTEDRIVFFMRLLLLCCEILENANGFPVSNESLTVYSAITGELTPAQRGQLHFELARVLMAIRNL